MTAEVQSVTTREELREAYDGSFYFIAGCGGDIGDWTTGYEDLLAEEGIGKPTRWIFTSGAAVNRYAGDIPRPDCNYFQEDVVIIMFPLDGLNAGVLAIFKIQMQDRWFDDVIDNMRR